MPFILDKSGEKLVMADVRWPVHSHDEAMPKRFGLLFPHTKDDYPAVGEIFEEPSLGKIAVERKLPDGSFLFQPCRPKEDEGIESANETFGKFLEKADLS